MDFTSANGWSINGGNVGIGTDSPLVFGAGYTSLDIRGDTVGGAISLGDATSQYGYVLADDTGLRLQAYGARSVDFWTNDVQHMRIDSAGNVGIGTNNPDYRLQAVDAGNYQFQVGAGTDFGLEMGRNSATGVFDFNNTQAGGYPISFSIDSAEAVRIDSAGNLLVGTPTSLSNARLVVKGTTNAAGDVAALFVNGGGSTIFNANNDGRLYAPLIAPVAGTNVTWQADGQITKASSSLRYKENVSAVEENALNQINELTIKRFNFIGQEDFTCVGLIAEEVSETSLSGVVFKDEEGRPDALHDPSLLAVALKAIQELTARLEALEA